MEDECRECYAPAGQLCHPACPDRPVAAREIERLADYWAAAWRLEYDSVGHRILAVELPA